MIHGLDEPAKPTFHPHYGEGMNIPDGGHACRNPSNKSSLSSTHDDDESPVGMSFFSYSPDNPMSPFSPPPRGNPARQGLSFQILQILYDEEKEKEQKPTDNLQKDIMNSVAEDLNSSFSSSEGDGSRRSSSSMSLQHPNSPGMISRVLFEHLYFDKLFFRHDIERLSWALLTLFGEIFSYSTILFTLSILTWPTCSHSTLFCLLF